MKKLFLLFSIIAVSVIVMFIGCRKHELPVDIPICVDNVGPVNGSQIETRTVRLSWTLARSAKTYDIYLDTVPLPSPPLAEAVSDTALVYMLPSPENATYYWFVVPKNGGEKPGCASTPTSFNTQPPQLMFVLNFISLFLFLLVLVYKVPNLIMQNRCRILYLICKIYFFHFKRRLLVTTLTLLNAIAAPAIIGFNKNPLTG